MSRAVVTGGCGLIGSWLVDLLLERGWDVAVVDALLPPTHGRDRPDWIRPEAEFYRVDVRIPGHLARAFRAGDVVFHQAAAGGFAPGAALSMTDVNVAGTANVLAAARNAGAAKVVVASSQAVYGAGVYECQRHGRFALERRDPALLEESSWDAYCRCGAAASPRMAREDDPVAPATVYALSKYYAERLALAAGAEWGLPVVALRYALCYGPRQSVSNPYAGICSIFATRILNGLPVRVYEDGRQSRDFTYVGDVAAANLLVAEDPRADGQVFNVGTGLETTVRGFVRQLGEALDIEPEVGVASGGYRPDDARSIVIDASGLRALGWEPAVWLPDGLRRYVEWFRSIPPPPDVFDEGEARMAAAGIVRR